MRGQPLLRRCRLRALEGSHPRKFWPNGREAEGDPAHARTARGHGGKKVDGRRWSKDEISEGLDGKQESHGEAPQRGKYATRSCVLHYVVILFELELAAMGLEPWT